MTKTKEEIEKSFRQDLEGLLKKYKADIGLDYRRRAYHQYQVIEVTIDAVYDDEYNQLSPFFSFDL